MWDNFVDCVGGSYTTIRRIFGRLTLKSDSTVDLCFNISRVIVIGMSESSDTMCPTRT